MAKIAVIGCGVIGLTSALAIQRKLGTKVNVTIFTKEISPYTTSDIAAGLWQPYAVDGTSDDKIIKWSSETFDYILDLWKQGKAKESGISLVTCIVITENPDHILPEWIKVTLGYSELSKEYLHHLSKQYNKTFTGGFMFVTFCWEASIFLPYLQQDFIKNGGTLEIKSIENLNELSDFDVIVNCSGLNSRTLVKDTSVEPIRGQIARITAPWQFHGFFTDTSYIIPNINCVIIGGTKQKGDYNLNVCEVDKRNILENCLRLIPSLESAQVIKHQVGQRPGRNGVQIALERKKLNERNVRVVHNYGHGGSGITLAIGCAEEAADLVCKAIGDIYGSKL